jgi:hypothetical protein
MILRHAKKTWKTQTHKVYKCNVCSSDPHVAPLVSMCMGWDRSQTIYSTTKQKHRILFWFARGTKEPSRLA